MTTDLEEIWLRRNELLAEAITEAVATWYSEYMQYPGCESLNAKADVYTIVKETLDRGVEV